jgi:hypothetical protein
MKVFVIWLGTGIRADGDDYGIYRGARLLFRGTLAEVLEARKS